MYKLSSVHILGVRLCGSIAWAVPAKIFTKRALAVLLVVSVAGCGSSESTSETTPTNPEPTQPSINTTAPAQDALGGYAVLPGADIDNASLVSGNVDGVFRRPGLDETRR